MKTGTRRPLVSYLIEITSRSAALLGMSSHARFRLRRRYVRHANLALGNVAGNDVVTDDAPIDSNRRQRICRFPSLPGLFSQPIRRLRSNGLILRNVICVERLLE
jgi:hypothetical protein